MKINSDMNLNNIETKEKSVPDNKPESKNTIFGDINNNQQIDADEWVKLVGAENDDKKISFLSSCTNELIKVSKFIGDINDTQVVKAFNDKVKVTVNAFNKAYDAVKPNEDNVKNDTVQPNGDNTSTKREIKNNYVNGSYTIYPNGRMVSNLSSNNSNGINPDFIALQEHYSDIKNNDKTVTSHSSQAIVLQNYTTQVAIYRDLLTRQANGETLNDGEINFINEFKETLEKIGLELASDGTLQNIN